MGSYISLVKGIEFLITGILSPVSMLSFTMQDPVRRAKSHGIEVISGISTTSPGTKSILSIYFKLFSFPSLMALIGQLYYAIFFILFKFLKVSIREVVAEDTERTRMQAA